MIKRIDIRVIVKDNGVTTDATHLGFTLEEARELLDALEKDYT